MAEQREDQSKEQQRQQEPERSEQDQQLKQPELDQTGPSGHPTAQQHGQWEPFDQQEEES